MNYIVTIVNYTQQERLEIVLDIVTQLRLTPGKGGNVNLYNDIYSFIPKFKKICNDYIKNEKDFNGVLYFLEIDKKIKYYLPIDNNNKAYFIIKMK